MNARNFSDAMDEIDSKYIEEALSCPSTLNSARPFRRLLPALTAAILALFLMGAGAVAVIYGNGIQNWFRHYWELLTGQQMSDEQAATIDHLSQGIGLQQTAGDITVTVDSATIGYNNFFLLLRVDGVAFSGKYAYGFEKVTVDTTPDPTDAGNAISGYGFQYHGIDGDGSILLLMDYSYAGGIENTRDTYPVNISLTLENLLQSPNMDKEKLVASGQWHFEFSLDQSKEIEIIRLPDTEIMVMDLEKQVPVPVTIENIELTNTGLRFQYDCQDGTLTLESHIDILLQNGNRISTGGGSGIVSEDGRTLKNSFQWEIPVNLNEAACVQIGDTQIAVPGR